MGILMLSLLLVATITFILTFSLFKKFNPGSTPLEKPLFWVIAIIATPLLYAACLFSWFTISSSYPDRTFDKAAWENNLDTRYEYVHDLITNQKLIGNTITETKNMLGEPDSESDSTLIYYIGYSPKYFLNSDPDWLEIALKDGKVARLQVLQ